MRDKIKTNYEIFRQKTYVIIDGTNTFWGKVFDVFLLFLITCSIVLFMLETVQSINQRYSTWLITFEWIITVLFTVEYVLRIISNPKPIKYVTSFYGIIDLLAILPMFLSFIIKGSKIISTVRVLRLLRVFRILSLVNFTYQATELKKAIYVSRTKIMVFVYFVLVICVILGSVMYMIENGETGFTSIPRSIYWCVVTLTTVGYGDIAPETPLGQVIATVIMILGYGIIAVPTGIVTSEYSRIRGKNDAKHATDTFSATEKHCLNCGETQHLPQAYRCHKCGEILQNSSEK